MMVSDPRYEGKPLLRLLELYVLSVIGALSATDRETLDAMAPKLQALYGGAGSWQDAVAASVHLPAGASAAIRDMWQKNQEIARTNRVPFTPQRFAELFVDENLVDGPR